MELYIFDMDGVLLRPHGYHSALQDTVRLAAEQSGFGSVHLSQQQIHRFEALGISSEWHSSALCLSVLTLSRLAGEEICELHLEPLFEAIAAQPMVITPHIRGEIAISHLAQQTGVPSNEALAWIQQSEQIEHSPTMNLFQSMILGDEIFSRMYGKPAILQTESYLKRFDERMISQENSDRLSGWATSPASGAAIMTNRPSYGPENILGAPDADVGAELVGMESLPLIGYGETTWLADKMGKPVPEVTKPHYTHAMAAILAASGWDSLKSLKFVSMLSVEWYPAAMEHLRSSRITVFEDTPAGVMSVQAAGDLLNKAKLDVSICKVGIAAEPAKIATLEALGAEVFEDVNQALGSLNHL